MHARTLDLSGAWLAVLLLAGCTGTPGGPAADRAVPPPEVEGPERLLLAKVPWRLEAAAGVPSLNVGVPLSSRFPIPFEVKDKVDLVNVTVDWSCQSGPLCQLLVMVGVPGQEIVHKTGPSPQTFTVTDPTVGKWRVWLGASEGAVVVLAEGRVQAEGTVFPPAPA